MGLAVWGKALFFCLFPGILQKSENLLLTVRGNPA
ncbi:hypothetical protein QE363_003661 [Sphingomonas sp. SORGH_AS870]|nr:hypothetical protein [Sphingomonas sp. SORGH_AS_0870]